MPNHESDVGPPVPIPAFDSEVSEKLYNLLYQSNLQVQDLAAELEQLEQKHDPSVYSELIRLLCHLRLNADEAKRHWLEILTHRELMEGRMGSFVDVRVAVVSYFLQVAGKLQNPTIIELRLLEQTQVFAYRDELTGLHNYRFFREYLDREIKRCGRYSTPVSLVMLDIDNFKHYNDTNGHEAGNEVLATMARLLAESTRSLDVPARYGGEEFVIILPATSRVDAALVAERTRQAIERHDFPHEDSQPGGSLTVSIGVVTYPNDATQLDELIRHADRAMYVAKAQGKNRVRHFGDNRRAHRRVYASLTGRYRSFALEYESLTTLNVSERGVLLRVEKELPVGSLVDINLTLPHSSRDISLCGRVLRIRESPDGGFEAGISIVDIPSQDQVLFMEYVRVQTPPSDNPEAQGR